MNNYIKVKAPATIANLACGFDVLGCAIHEPGDTIEMEMNNSGIITIEQITGEPRISMEPEKNVVGAVLSEIKEKHKIPFGFSIKLHKGIALGSGIGSSAASSAAAAVAANHLLGNIFNQKQLVEFAMAGEFLASGSRHADNVAPAIMGGITIVRSYEPLDIISLEPPDDLYCIVLHPDIKLETKHSRAVLKQDLPLKTAVKQWGNIAAFVAGILKSDYKIIADSLNDYVAEPYRAILIPGYYQLKQHALNAGALGAGISGSGPSVFALAKGKNNAYAISASMSEYYQQTKIKFSVYVSKVNKQGTIIIS